MTPPKWRLRRRRTRLEAGAQRILWRLNGPRPKHKEKRRRETQHWQKIHSTKKKLIQIKKKKNKGQRGDSQEKITKKQKRFGASRTVARRDAHRTCNECRHGVDSACGTMKAKKKTKKKHRATIQTKNQSTEANETKKKRRQENQFLTRAFKKWLDFIEQFGTIMQSNKKTSFFKFCSSPINLNQKGFIMLDCSFPPPKNIKLKIEMKKIEHVKKKTKTI